MFFKKFLRLYPEHCIIVVNKKVFKDILEIKLENNNGCYSICIKNKSIAKDADFHYGNDGEQCKNDFNRMLKFIRIK